MNAFDVLILALAAILGLVGAWKGLIRAALGIAGVVIGLILGLRWERAVASVVGKVVEDELWARLLAFVAIVVAVSIVAVIASWAARRVLKTARLAWVDRLLGASAGVLCAVLLVGAVALILSTTAPGNSPFLSESRLAPIALTVSRGLAKLAPEKVRQKFYEEMKRLADRV